MPINLFILLNCYSPSVSVDLYYCNSPAFNGSFFVAFQFCVALFSFFKIALQFVVNLIFILYIFIFLYFVVLFT